MLIDSVDTLTIHLEVQHAQVLQDRGFLSPTACDFKKTIGQLNKAVFLE